MRPVHSPACHPPPPPRHVIQVLSGTLSSQYVRPALCSTRTVEHPAGAAFGSAAPENPQSLSLCFGRSCGRNCLFQKRSQGEKASPISPYVGNCFRCSSQQPSPCLAACTCPGLRPAPPPSTSHRARSPSTFLTAAWGSKSEAHGCLLGGGWLALT